MDYYWNNRKKYIGGCCGNNFVIIDCRDFPLDNKLKPEFSKKNIGKYCVDSALFISKSESYDIILEIFEKDGSESDSCGNGMLLVSYMIGLNTGKIKMKNGLSIIEGSYDKQSILVEDKFLSIQKMDKEENYFYVKIMGEPHIVYMVDNFFNFDLTSKGFDLQKRYQKGINVSILERKDEHKYLIKTFERGVLAETKSCGTGSLASYVAICNFYDRIYQEPIEFLSVGGSHWVSADKDIFRLETLKTFCKFTPLE